MRELNWIEAELLLALWHLRYLSSEQIWRGWYRERTFTAAQKRLSRLGQGEVLRRVLLRNDRYRAAWQLGAEGYRKLRRLKGIEVDPYGPVSEMFVPHLLDTNEVFVALAGGEPVWERLPFTWTGSHRSAIPFERKTAKPGIIRPDAVIQPKGSGVRFFVELDRSTERIRPRDGRNSIHAKLEAYRRAICGSDRDGQRWVAAHFLDGRTTRVLFVTSRSDDRASDPKLRNRRARSVEAIAHNVFGTHDNPVVCIALADVDGLRKAVFDNEAAPPPAPEPTTFDLDRSGIRALAELYRRAVEAAPCVPRENREALRDAVRKAHAVLQPLVQATKVAA